MPLIVITSVLAVAVLVLGIVVWRQWTAERQRSDARVAALARAIDGGTDETRLADADASGEHLHEGTMVLAIRPVAQPSRVPAFALATLVVLGTGGLLVAGMSVRNTAPAERADVGASIELVAMRHLVERETLIVSGFIRNSSSMPSPPLAAVVSVLGQDGRVIARGASPLEPEILAAGKETSFRVSVAPISDPNRYRVAFTNGRQIVPHVDRRPDTARTARAVASERLR